ncbi:MAG: hypothetical protein RIS70_4332 [Planctomycetota bacterium]|jgi:hypothetical protein
MENRLLPPSFLFRFAIPCRSRSTLWGEQGANLEEQYRLPFLGEVDQRTAWADVRAAWSREGISFYVRVAGKRQPIWCRDSRIEDSDGFQVWIDTRDTHNVHRASRFCHRFAFLPAGSRKNLDDPMAIMLAINRARESPKPVSSTALKVRREKRIDGYLLQAHIPAEALTGFDPTEHPRLGFMYAVIDRELGWQTLNLGPEFPITEDPSLWSTLELVD